VSVLERLVKSTLVWISLLNSGLPPCFSLGSPVFLESGRCNG